MATTEAAKPAAVTTPHVPKPLPSRNPLPLSAAQEGQVRDMYYARVRGICAEEIRIFAECARGRTMSATWACRAERGGMNQCMVANATQENQDAAREEWFAKRMEKRRLKEEEDAKKAQA